VNINFTYLSDGRYLIEGDKGAVLHTGDMRAEASFIENLRRNPFLAKYIAPKSYLDFRPKETGGHNEEVPQTSTIFSTLEAIYLDTASLLGTVEVPSKVKLLK
jgi:hypothetical protein